MSGCVEYKNGDRTPIPYQAIDEPFKAQITHFLDILDANTEPKRVPSMPECNYCEITEEDCPDKVRSKIENIGEEPPDLPM
jgi:hypothetical protein